MKTWCLVFVGLAMACVEVVPPAPAADPAVVAKPSGPAVVPKPNAPAVVPEPNAPAPAPLPPAEDDVVLGPPAPMENCDEELARAGIRFAKASLPLHNEGPAKLTCGAAQVVMYLRGPEKIAWSVPPVLTCKMALALASFEKIVEEESTRIFGKRVTHVEQLGTYNCRVIPTAPTLMSEHGYANAIDIGHITLEGGRVVDIYRDFDRGDEEPKTKSGRFLRNISRRANDEDVFSHVLTPFFDRAHDNHFHLDLARWRRDGTRPR